MHRKQQEEIIEFGIKNSRDEIYRLISRQAPKISYDDRERERRKVLELVNLMMCD